ncbi:FAD synthase [Candidatus Bathyarchaeota archaeon]|nr:FAD synthase [Candidatus Bathyarchaeota archaeon]
MTKKQVVVLASGVFDVLHYGHVAFLEEAKKHGGKNAKLVVIVARDSTVERLKGRKTVIPEDQRRALVEALKPVDEAILGYESSDFKQSVERAIQKIQPDIIAVGYDQNDVESIVRDVVEKGKFKVRIVKVRKFGSEELNSSSKIKRKLLEMGQNYKRRIESPITRSGLFTKKKT